MTDIKTKEDEDRYVLKKLAANDLIVAYMAFKRSIISGLVIAIVIYGSYSIFPSVALIATLVALGIFAWQFWTVEKKIVYYEKKYDITRPKTILSALSNLNVKQDQQK